MAKITKSVNCPKCHSTFLAEILPKRYKFLIYHCPSCSSNVVVYAGKVNIISDKLVKMLFKSKKLKTCGDLLIPDTQVSKGEGITKDALLNLKILLETESDVSKIISKL